MSKCKYTVESWSVFVLHLSIARKRLDAMAAAGGLEKAEAMMAAKTTKFDDAEFDNFLSKVTEVQQQIQLLKEGVDPVNVSGVSALACVSSAFQKNKYNS